jgi:hypothetical protein
MLFITNKHGMCRYHDPQDKMVTVAPLKLVKRLVNEAWVVVDGKTSCLSYFFLSLT